MTTRADTTQPAPATTATVADLARLAESSRGWELAEASAGRLRVDPDDEPARIYLALAGCLIRCPELAMHAVEGVDSPDAEEIRAVASALPTTLMMPSAIIETCTQNLGSLVEPERSVLQPSFEEWAERVRSKSRTFYRVDRGNIIARTGACITSWCWLRDARTQTTSLDLGFDAVTTHSTVNSMPGMLIVQGITPPWLLARVLDAVGNGAQGYVPRVYSMHDAEPTELLDALGVVRMPLGSVRLRSADSLEEELATQWRWRLPKQVIGDPSASERASEILTRVRSQQRHEVERISKQVARNRRARDTRFYAERFNSGNPLRILLPATRYSTYVRHAMDDLAGAITRAGDQPLVLSESSPDVRPSAAHELEAHAQFDPDLTIVANWPRALRESASPAGAPYACWVQDMLGTIFDPRVGAAQSDLDFMVGLVNASLVRDFGYPVDRALFSTMPACPVKFHDGPIDANRRERFACDVAYVSHQSEPVERLVERLLARATSDTEMRLVRTIEHHVSSLINRDERPGTWDLAYHVFEEITRESLSEVCGQANAGDMQTSHTLVQVTLPMIERAIRHSTLMWAKESCEACGFTLALYGRGWERTELAPFARGEVAHAEDLRACYAGAACHLHASLTTNAHQRVFECALAGGLMLRRGPSPDAPVVMQETRRRLCPREPDMQYLDRIGYRIADEHARLPPDSASHDVRRLDAITERGRVGVFHEDAGEYRAEVVDVQRERLHAQAIPAIPLEQFPDWAYDDAEETRFATRDELDRAIARSVEDPDWRSERVSQHRKRTLAYNTTDAFWRRVRAHIAKGLVS